MACVKGEPKRKIDSEFKVRSEIFLVIFLYLFLMASATPIPGPATSTSASTPMNRIQCQLCSNQFFDSRNQLFDHLREEHGYQREIHQISAKERTDASVQARSTFENPHHDAYYRRQCQAGVMTLQEWEQAKEYFKKPLTMAFRISSSSRKHPHYVQWLEREAGETNLSTSPYFTSCRIAQRPLREWSETAQQILSDAQDLGIANRQELCSVVPPLLLMVDSPNTGNKQLTVLDLCAAPGSKTLQLLDSLTTYDDTKTDDDSPSLSSSSPSFEGMLVANDSNRSRLLTVARRARILGSSKAAMILNASDGRYFPALRKWAGYKLKFDRILADVPCSGDGTFRKLSSTEWSRWNVQNHLSLHKLQVRLLQRSLELVKKGGRVVYSTCSLDPIENEAVVATAITNMGGPSLYRIVQPPEYLEQGAAKPFLYTQGASSWIVPHPKFDANTNNIVYENYQEVPEALQDKRVLPTMFPPSDFQIQQMLRNCCRILPQHLDSGGFFCAIIERLPPLYFAVCCPKQRNQSDLESVQHHGRIYYILDNDDAVSSTKKVRNLLRVESMRYQQEENGDGLDYYFEGLPTFETAQEWLRQHSAFVVGRSDVVSEFPDPGPSSVQPKDWYNLHHKTTKKDPIYTPLLNPPHPDLVKEFVDFFGLKCCAEDAQIAEIQRFPVEQLVVIGGGEQALQVTRNRMGQVVGSVDEDLKTHSKSDGKKTKFFQLTLVSNEIRSLFSGGAKFNPMEMGLALCWVPVTPLIHSSCMTRAERSGRYGLMDEAAEYIGKCATKRLLTLSIEDSIELLEKRTLPATRFWVDVPSEGAIVVVCKTSEAPLQQISLSCVLKPCGSLELLAETRTAAAWLRLLQTCLLLR